MRPVYATVELTTCADCGVFPGYEHSQGCDVARCLLDGNQRLSCGHKASTRPSIWTGMWPGELECIEYDFWTKWVDKDDKTIPLGDWERDGHWQTTSRDDPDRRPDSNKINIFWLVWNKRLHRWVKRDFEARV